MKKTFIMLVLTGLILSACNREETIGDIDQKAVERWQALIDGDFEKAYEYLAPSYRELESLNSYISRMATINLNTNWKNVEFDNKTCGEKVCQVNLDLSYTYEFPKRSMGQTNATTPIKENWILNSGHWYFMPDEKKKL